jgi:hypothetical protein
VAQRFVVVYRQMAAAAVGAAPPEDS